MPLIFRTNGTGSHRALRPQARRISLLRLLLVSLALGIVLFFEAGKAEIIPDIVTHLHEGLLALVGVSMVLVIWVDLVRARWQMALHLVFDLLWIGVLIYYTGGVASPAVVLLFAVVLISNLEISGALPFAMPAFASLILAGNASLYLADWHPFPQALLSQWHGLIDNSRVLGFLTIQIAALFLVDLLGQLLASRVVEQRFFTGVVLDQLAEGVLAVDLQGAVVYANAEIARLLALDSSPQGMMADRVLADLPGVLTLMRGRGFDEFSEQVGDRHLILRAQDVRSTSGKPIGRTLVVADETRLRVLEDNARRAEQLAQLGEMAAGIAHEVRNPLTSLRGCAQELADICTKFGHADAASLARIMIDESDRLARIVGDFLAMSRMRDPVRQQLTLGPVFDEIRVLSRRRRDLPAALVLDMETEPGCPDIFADPDQLRQVLSNLINNAIDAVINVPTPRVSCVARRAADDNALSGLAVEILVTDNGCGIPPEHKERVFAPFFSTKAQGTGLGLSLVSRMVRQHEGALRLESPPAGGTVVRLLWPAQLQTRGYDRMGRPAEVSGAEAPG